MSEEIYQECLEIELEFRSIPFQSKADLKCFYKGRELRKRYFPDLFVSGCLVVELKAVTELAPEHVAQLMNYMRVARQPVGYLLNFGHKGTLEWKRFILSEFIRTCDNRNQTPYSEQKISVPSVSISGLNRNTANPR